MGQKTHPIGFRLGIIKDWQANWFAAKPAGYRKLVLEDLAIRKTILSQYPDAGISRVEIERSSNDAVITIHTARPGIVIGRGGQRVDDLRRVLEGLTERRARLNVQEIRQPEMDAYLVARSVADQLERRIAFRRAMRQAVTRTMQAGAQGIKIISSGRLGGSDIARREKAMEGRVPLHTLRADIDYGLAEALTEYGKIGVKVWIFKGEILTTSTREPEIEDIPTIEVMVTAEEEPAEDAVTVEDMPSVEVTVTAEEVTVEAAATVEDMPPAEVTVTAEEVTVEAAATVEDIPPAEVTVTAEEGAVEAVATVEDVQPQEVTVTAEEGAVEAVAAVEDVQPKRSRRKPKKEPVEDATTVEDMPTGEVTVTAEEEAAEAVAAEEDVKPKRSRRKPKKEPVEDATTVEDMPTGEVTVTAEEEAAEAVAAEEDVKPKRSRRKPKKEPVENATTEES